MAGKVPVRLSYTTRQHSCTFCYLKRSEHRGACLIASSLSIIFVQSEGTISAAVDLQGERVQRTFPRILHLRSERENRALPNEQGKNIERSRDREGARPRIHGIGPEVDPNAGRQIYLPLCGTLIQNRRDQDVRPKKIFVAQVEYM